MDLKHQFIPISREESSSETTVMAVTDKAHTKIISGRWTLLTVKVREDTEDTDVHCGPCDRLASCPCCNPPLALWHLVTASSLQKRWIDSLASNELSSQFVEIYTTSSMASAWAKCSFEKQEWPCLYRWRAKLLANDSNSDLNYRDQHFVPGCKYVIFIAKDVRWGQSPVCAAGLSWLLEEL